ncbi:unnamed protein product [Rhodiola kirilowii]
MSTLRSSCEIVESDDLDSQSVWGSRSKKNIESKHGKKYAMEDDINRLLEAVIRTTVRGSSQQVSRDALRKKAMKKPIRAGSSPSSSTGASAPVSLKQALRGICISQASELAAMKRLSKPQKTCLSVVLEVESVRKNYTALLSEAAECSYPMRDGKENMVEVSLIPEINSVSNTIKQSFRFPITRVLDPAASTSETAIATMSKAKMGEKLRQLGKAKIHADVGTRKPNMDLGLNRPQRAAEASCTAVVTDVIVSSSEIVPTSARTAPERDLGGKLPCASAKSSAQCKTIKLPTKSAQLIKPYLWKKNKPSKKVGGDPCSSSSSCSFRPYVEVDCMPSMNDKPCQTPSFAPNSKEGDNACPMPNNVNRVEDSFGMIYPNTDRIARVKSTESRFRGIGDFCQSSKSSIGDVSCSTSMSEGSSFSRSSLSGCRPHTSKDLRWEVIHHVQKLYGNLSLSHFKLLKKLGCGDIGTVYLAELRSTNSLFAVKVMDNEFLTNMNKMSRAQTEREIMQMLDHPFLPTLYAYFTTDKFSCLVMEYCRGGDLHVLRQKQPGRCFSEQAARFYCAEILLALEYLHLHGVVYRDLKPENILVGEDGHIMLTDFDLSLRCSVHPTLVKSLSAPASTSPKKTASTCIDPFCMQPTWQVPCFTPKSSAERTKKSKSDPAAQVSPMPQLVVEPTNARSNSFVGTHEYLAPEIIEGEGHGSAVDWWTFGIFMYELLYGKTPFKGQANEDTLANVVSQSLTFPQAPIVSFHSRDLIRRLLTKDPNNRLGSSRGAAEIKQHSFFQGLNWALIRSAAPPELPNLLDNDSLAANAKWPQERELFKQF